MRVICVFATMATEQKLRRIIKTADQTHNPWYGGWGIRCSQNRADSYVFEALSCSPSQAFQVTVVNNEIWVEQKYADVIAGILLRNSIKFTARHQTFVSSSAIRAAISTKKTPLFQPV